MPVPNVDGGSAPAPTKGTLPDWAIFGGGLLLVAAIAEGLYAVRPAAGYAFAFLVLMGYAISGNRLDEGIKFLRSIGLVI